MDYQERNLFEAELAISDAKYQAALMKLALTYKETDFYRDQTMEHLNECRKITEEIQRLNENSYQYMLLDYFAVCIMSLAFGAVVGKDYQIFVAFGLYVFILSYHGVLWTYTKLFTGLFLMGVILEVVINRYDLINEGLE